MRIFPSLASITTAGLLFAASIAFGQATNNQGVYCNSGLSPDGYIDFSQMPPAPTFSSQTGPATSTTFSATIPVTGVPGLNVTITIPPMLVTSGAPLYTTNGSQIQLNVLGPPSSPPNTLFTMTFDQAIVRGVGMNIINPTGDRVGYSYSLAVPLTPDQPIYSNTLAGDSTDLYSARTQNLQVVAIDSTIPEADVLTTGLASKTPIISNVRIQSTSAPDPSSAVPTDGLQQWLRADKGFNPVSINKGTWLDQSGNGHDAIPSTGHEPTLSVDGHTCKPTWMFNGSSWFDFNLPIAGWNQMTTFVVAASDLDPPPDSYDSFASTVLWTENAGWGNTFVSPYQTHIFARFGTTQPNTNLEYMRPGAGIGGDFTITRAVHNNDTDSLYVNGFQVLSQGGNNPVLGGVTGAGTIGAGINGTFYDGQISEILVYNRVLSDVEAAQVESYLRNKYGTQ